jgi:nitrogen regulatory protein PII
MKMVVATLRPEQLPAVKQALFAAQIRHITVTNALGTAPKSEQRKYRGVAREVSLFRRLRLEVAVTDARVETAMQAIAEGAHEGGGWGRIFVMDLHDTMNIWTGERGPRTL